MTRRSSVPYIFRATTSVFLAIPAFFTALIALIVFGLHYGIAPIIGYEPAFPANLKYLWLPALVICTTLVPVLARVLHSSIMETMGEEFVETGDRPRRRPLALLLVLSAEAVAGADHRAPQLHGRRHDRLDGHHRNHLLASRASGATWSAPSSAATIPSSRACVLVFGLLVVVVGLVGDIIANWLDPRVGIS